MKKENLVKEFVKTISINKIKTQVNISIYSHPDYDTPVDDQDFDSEQDRLDHIERFNNGTLTQELIEVEARALGLNSSDYLGGCQFNVSNYEQEVLSIVEEYGMIDSAIKELKSNIIKQAKLLAKYNK